MSLAGLEAGTKAQVQPFKFQESTTHRTHAVSSRRIGAPESPSQLKLVPQVSADPIDDDLRRLVDEETEDLVEDLKEEYDIITIDDD